jgi:hypothetical protein
MIANDDRIKVTSTRWLSIRAPKTYSDVHGHEDHRPHQRVRSGTAPGPW